MPDILVEVIFYYPQPFLVSVQPVNSPVRHPTDRQWSTVFVYGTLLRGECNHSLLTSATFLGDDYLAGACLFDAGAYPFLQLASQGQVQGEVYRIAPSTLLELDELEEHPTVYYRQWVELVSGRWAWTYVGRVQYVVGLPAIASGSWQRRSFPSD